MATKTKTAPAAKRTAKAKAAPAAKAPATEAPQEFGLRAAPTKQGLRRTMLPEGAAVEMLVTANPKRAGSGAHVRFNQYLALHAKGKFTVADVLNAGVQPSDLIYNLKHGYIAVAGVEVKGSTVVVG